RHRYAAQATQEKRVGASIGHGATIAGRGGPATVASALARSDRRHAIARTGIHLARTDGCVAAGVRNTRGVLSDHYPIYRGAVSEFLGCGLSGRCFTRAVRTGRSLGL